MILYPTIVALLESPVFRDDPSTTPVPVMSPKLWNIYVDRVMAKHSEWFEIERAGTGYRGTYVSHRVAVRVHENAPEEAFVLFDKMYNTFAQVSLATPDWAEWYAEHVLHSRWPPGESIIATDTQASTDYAIRVLRGPFPAGEAAISRSPYHRKFYNKELKTWQKNGHFLNHPPL